MLVGRVAERARLDRLLAEARDGHGGALVLRGDAGVGKTALLDYAAGAADGYRVLRAVGVASEATLAFSGVLQLARPVLGTLQHVPAAQRDALERALGLGESGRHDVFLAYAGTLSLLAAVAEEQPLLCLVDDAHWLDAGSADALTFAARRLEAERVAILFAARPGGASDFYARDIEELAVGGLEESAARELMAGSAVSVAPAVVHRLIEATAGNPLALIEVPASLSEEQRAGEVPLEDPLPAGARVERAFLDRTRGLSGAARHALLVAAASDTGDVDVIVRASGDAGAALDELEATGLVRVRGRELAFRHPLVRSAVYFAAPAGDRRAAHAALADAIGSADAGRRAWHLAASAIGRDEQLARSLEEAASAAGRRSIEDEGRLLVEAARLTPEPAARVPRLLRAGIALHEAGRGSEALALLDEGLILVDDPLLRADLHEARLYAARAIGVVGANVETCLAEAERVAALDPFRAASLLYHASYQAYEHYDLERSEALSRRMRELAAASGRLSLPALVSESYQALLAGHSADVRSPALRGAEAALDQDRLDEKAVDLAESLTITEDYGATRRLLERAVLEFRARGRVVDLVRALAALANLELRLGNVARARVAAHEALGLAQDGALDYWISWSLARLAAVDAVMGRAQECRDAVTRAIAIGREHGDREVEALADDALGRLELGLGNVEEAIAALAQTAAIAGRITHPGYLLWRPDLVEALERAGRHGDARKLLPELAAGAGEGPWAAAVAARCRALVEGGDELFQDALASCDERVSPFERARTQLVWGERLRRDGRRVAAREHLAAALAEFDRVGAPSWAGRASEELRASGQTVRRGSAAIADQLTPRELEIALWAATGLTNREISARLFLSPKTVELHLGRIYRKLGLRSRTELAQAMPAERAAVGETPYASPRE